MLGAAPSHPFLHARDLLLRHRESLGAARREFRWPVLDRFNWALDHFDRMAEGNEAPALRFAGSGEAGGGDAAGVSFAALSARSNQVATGQIVWQDGTGVCSSVCTTTRTRWFRETESRLYTTSKRRGRSGQSTPHKSISCSQA